MTRALKKKTKNGKLQNSLKMLYERNKERKNGINESYIGKKKQKQAVREREAEETGGNILKADNEKSLKRTEEKRGDFVDIYVACMIKILTS